MTTPETASKSQVDIGHVHSGGVITLNGVPYGADHSATYARIEPFSIPRDGINMFSFSITPGNYQPMGNAPLPDRFGPRVSLLLPPLLLPVQTAVGAEMADGVQSRKRPLETQGVVGSLATASTSDTSNTSGTEVTKVLDESAGKRHCNDEHAT